MTMELYYINLLEDRRGYLSVHRYGCEYLAEPSNRYYLGIFPGPQGAVRKACEKFLKVVCCEKCCVTSLKTDDCR